MDFKTIRVTLDGPVAVLTLHRPASHNAWTGRMHHEIRTACVDIERDASVRAVVITGEPPAFSVGGDREALVHHAASGSYDNGLPSDAPRPGTLVDDRYDEDMAWMMGYRLPIIAAVNGACAGISLALACFADLRFVAADAKITTAAPKLGLPAEYGLSWVLPRLVGVTRAADLLLSGRVFTGTDSAEWGLWNGVAPTGAAALQMALDYAHMLAATTGPVAVTDTKRQLYEDVSGVGAVQSVRESKRLLDIAMARAEYRAGIEAFVNRTAPNFPNPTL